MRRGFLQIFVVRHEGRDDIVRILRLFLVVGFQKISLEFFDPNWTILREIQGGEIYYRMQSGWVRRWSAFGWLWKPIIFGGGWAIARFCIWACSDQLQMWSCPSKRHKEFKHSTLFLTHGTWNLLFVAYLHTHWSTRAYVEDGYLLLSSKHLSQCIANAFKSTLAKPKVCISYLIYIYCISIYYIYKYRTCILYTQRSMWKQKTHNLSKKSQPLEPSNIIFLCQDGSAEWCPQAGHKVGRNHKGSP